jgi:hypothetical protein
MVRPMTVRQSFIHVIDKEPLALAHHPLCGRFEDHFFHVGGRRLCIGCFTVYPTALSILVVLFLVNNQDFIGSLSIAVVLLVFDLLRFLPHRTHRAAPLFNIVLGISLGAAIWSLIIAPGEAFLLDALFVFSVASIFSFLKGWLVLKKCKGCEEYARFPKCY